MAPRSFYRLCSFKRNVSNLYMISKEFISMNMFKPTFKIYDFANSILKNFLLRLFRTFSYLYI